jgi:hypothetical protein
MNTTSEQTVAEYKQHQLDMLVWQADVLEKNGRKQEAFEINQTARSKPELLRRTVLIVIALVSSVFTARAADEIAYIALPTGIGYAIDAKGARYPNAFCVRDTLSAPRPQYPYLSSTVGDSAAWARYPKGNGLYRLQIDLKTGCVTRVTIIKSTGTVGLDSVSTNAFAQWAFKPGKWKEVIIPTTVRTTWVRVISG